MTTPVPQAAIDAACDALDKRYREEYHLGGFDREHSEPDVRAVLDAGAPAIRDDERQRLFGNSPDREQAFADWIEPQPFVGDPHEVDIAREAFGEAWQQQANRAAARKRRA